MKKPRIAHGKTGFLIVIAHSKLLTLLAYNLKTNMAYMINVLSID